MSLIERACAWVGAPSESDEASGLQKKERGKLVFAFSRTTIARNARLRAMLISSYLGRRALDCEQKLCFTESTWGPGAPSTPRAYVEQRDGGG